MLIILGRPFLLTSRVLLDFDTNRTVMRIENKQQSFNMENPSKQPSYSENYHRVDHCESYKSRLNEGEIVSRDDNGNQIVQRVKNEPKKCNQCLKCKTENPFSSHRKEPKNNRSQAKDFKQVLFGKQPNTSIPFIYSLLFYFFFFFEIQNDLI